MKPRCAPVVDEIPIGRREAFSSGNRFPGSNQRHPNLPRAATRSRIGRRTLSSWKAPASTIRPTWTEKDYCIWEDLRITERYRRPDFGHLLVEFTFTDPKYYERPWTATIPFGLMPDSELIEHFCENEKDLGSLIRK